MKKIFYFIATLGMAITAQAQDTLYFYKDGVMTDKKAVLNVDSITFFETNDTLTIDSGSAYVNQKNFTTMPATSSSSIDYNGDNYTTVKIGDQTWFAENLRTTKYNDGTEIELVKNAKTWKKNYDDETKKPMRCWYKHDSSLGYGALYNWFVVNKGNLCPTGWRVPKDADWKTLTDYLGGRSVAGGKLKNKLKWAKPNTGAPNEVGFFANPGSIRLLDCQFGYLGTDGYWWSATTDSYDTTKAFFRQMEYDSEHIISDGQPKYAGMTVRCIKN